MTAAPDLLTLAREHGVDLYVEGGAIRLRAESEPSAALVEQLREHKTALLKLLSQETPPPLSATDQDAITEAMEERASIMEIDGHQDRAEAEQAAAKAMRVYRYRLTTSRGWCTLIAPGWTLEDAEKDLGNRHEERFIEVIEHRPMTREKQS